MVRVISSLGDRLLAKFVPTASASAAALCRGSYMGYWSSCEWFCYRGNPNRSEKIKYCPATPGCKFVCYDCC